MTPVSSRVRGVGGAVPGRINLARRRSLRVALVSDTHGHLHPEVESIVRGSDLCLHAGDLGSAEIAQRLRDACEHVLVVRGNNDVPAKWRARDRNALKALPSVVEAWVPGGMIVAVHGDRHNPVSMRHAKLRREFETARCIVYGHSHRLEIDDSERPWVVNPGAAGRARTRGGASCLRLTSTRDEWSIETFRFSNLHGG